MDEVTAISDMIESDYRLKECETFLDDFIDFQNKANQFLSEHSGKVKAFNFKFLDFTHKAMDLAKMQSDFLSNTPTNRLHRFFVRGRVERDTAYMYQKMQELTPQFEELKTLLYNEMKRFEMIEDEKESVNVPVSQNTNNTNMRNNDKIPDCLEINNQDELSF